MKNKKLEKNILLVLLQALLAGVLCFLCVYFGLFRIADSLYKDKLYQIPRPMDKRIKIIAIDAQTLSEYGPINTWDRSRYNELLDLIGDYASVVAYDVMFIGEMDEESDEAFRANVESRNNVVLANHLVLDASVETDENGKKYINRNHIKMIEYPFIEKASQGYPNVSADDDGIIRKVIPKFLYSGDDENANASDELCSLSYMTYVKYCELNSITAKDFGYGEKNIYYAGRPFDYEAVSMVDVLEDRIDPRLFTGCIVLVGAYVNGLQDQFPVPNSNDQMYGVEINANLVQALLEDCFPKDADVLMVSIIFSLIVFGLYILFSYIHIRWGTVIFILSEIAAVGVGILLYTKSLLSVPMIYLNVFIIVSYVTTLVFNYIKETLAKKRISSAFRKYVAPQVVDDIIKQGKLDITLGGESKDIAVLFVDIRGFTPLSESLPPEKVVEILNRYLNLTTNSVFKNSGTLDKFIGDATMAVFNAPFDLEDYEYKAVCAAFDIVSGAKELEEVCMEMYGKKVAFGVGVNCGEAVVGNIGCDFRMDYTAIGDTVNTAARLEANAKAGQVLISKALYERLKGRIKVNEIGTIPLKGKAEGCFVY
ncbi:MAG: adenylate/guanylate cyclase domain-containing protein, partial [Lachnospiraceae bacterium]|nr:adenylate/guanylate cyclase domain-containing protein [Lachnospiraceae bacterium]